MQMLRILKQFYYHSISFNIRHRRLHASARSHCVAMGTPVRKAFTTDVGQMQWRRHHVISSLHTALRYTNALAVWLSGNALASINVVALRQTRLVLGWVTVCDG